MTMPVPPLRILYVTTLTNADEPPSALMTLARTLHHQEDQFMVVLLGQPLPTTDIPTLDDSGMRWLYAPLPTWQMAARRRGWQAILQRWQPDIIHFDSRLDAKTIQQIMRLVPQRQRIACIVEEAGQSPRISTGATLVWPPLAEVATWAALSMPRSHEATGTTFPFVGLADPQDLYAILAYCQEVERLRQWFPTLCCTLLAAPPIYKTLLRKLAPEIHLAVRLVQHVDDWLAATYAACGAIGLAGTALAPQLCGAALALNRPVILQESPSDPALAQLIAKPTGDTYLAHLNACARHATPAMAGERDEFHLLRRMYHGARLWMSAPTNRGPER